MKLYKLTDKGYTRNDTQWEIGVTNVLEPSEEPQLCSPSVFHAYRSLELGLLLNPVQANIKNPTVFECEGEIIIEDFGKCGVFELTPIQEIELPAWYGDKTTLKRIYVQFAVLCAEEVLHYFTTYDNTDDRPQNAINAAKEYLKTGYAARAAAADAAYAARAAAAAYATAAADAAYATADAAYAAYAAAYAAANAGLKIDFNSLAKKAISLIMGE